MGKDQIIIMDRIEGKAGKAFVVFTNLPVWASEDGSKKRMDVDISVAPFDEINKNQPVFAKKKGAFKKKYSCRSCGEALDISAAVPMDFTFDVACNQFPTFTFAMNVPGVVCGVCGIGNAVSAGGIEEEIGSAIIEAVNSNSIEM
ncbi:MAG: hypothetical protein HN929_09590 [Chloroflexi bacterium]|jgi:hypothetical protein|nr:hypothetical protein [Chloroflexota bacterium]MBT7081701.1 hypothetical protein [Chloroflexota bacterium]MBT7289144.1 hypothetical protein [Chloroflexota bacterium]